jgi:nitrogenase molybdenum-iron protein alpha chain
MPIDIRSFESPTRENRLGAITGYEGTIKDLASKASGCALKNRERSFSQTSACSSGCAQGHLSGIRDAAIVSHAPIGCAADSIGANVQNKWAYKIRNWEYHNVNFICTNMTEEDTVFGATGKLREAVREAYRRFDPKAIFVTTSCTSAIIGEDINGILDELRTEIPVPLAPVFCEGFRSKVWASGFDAAYHAILTWIVKPPREKTNAVNMINFRGSAKEIITKILARLSLRPVFIAPFSTIEELAKTSESVATISICGTLGGYFGNGLEEHYGVPYVKSMQPHGIAGMDSWLRGLGQAAGKEREVEQFIMEEKQRIAPELEEIRAKLKGRKAVIGMGPSFGHNYVRVLEELGVEVIWGATWHFDQHYDHGACPESTLNLARTEREKDLPVSVCDQQNFELLNLLNRLRPDIYVSRHGGTSVWATKMGITSVMVADEFSAFGYQGLVDFGYRIIDSLANRSLAKNLAARIKLPYTDWWLGQDSFSLLKEVEVV